MTVTGDETEAARATDKVNKKEPNKNLPALKFKSGKIKGTSQLGSSTKKDQTKKSMIIGN